MDEERGKEEREGGKERREMYNPIILLYRGRVREVHLGIVKFLKIARFNLDWF